MRINNQKPIILSPVYTDAIAKDFEPLELLKNVTVKPLFSPMINNTPVTITDNGHDLSEDDIVSHILLCCQDSINLTEERFVKDLFRQTLVNFDDKTNIVVDETFVIQSAYAAKLPEPSDTVIYTPAQDVIPTARQFLGGQCDYDMFFASLAYYARPNTLGFYFANELAFENFKTWFDGQVSMFSSLLTPDVNRLTADFQKLSLTGLTESLILRNDDNDNNEPYSFARLLTSQLMLYSNTVSNAEFGILPFNISELICPKTMTFVNVEKHSRATARAVAQEWKLIQNALTAKPKIISNRKLNRLTAAQRNLQKISQAANAQSNAGAQTARAMNIRFSKTQPTAVNMIRLIKKVMDKMAFVNKSMNSYKSVKMTYARANRRNPDDFNKQGKMVSTKYNPDIPLYIDTSGSITERNYQDAVKACIHMAKKFNINMYFNSFSHCLSQTTKLTLKDKPVAMIYKEFQKIPKVSGGTDYEQIWHFINKSPKRLKEISIVITDFEYYAPRQYIKHPANLYYVPCTVQDYDNMVHWATEFAKTMLHNDPNIRKHILF